MPTYEYECAACGRKLEAFQKISDKPLKKCPKCGKSKLERLISATAFQLKGGGWYKDLYSKPASTEVEGVKKKTDKADSTKKPEKSDTKSDTKPAGKKTA